MNRPIITAVDIDQARIVTPLGTFKSLCMKDRKEWMSETRMS